jgi:UDP-N-acetylglucosamine acyltransferase
LDSNNASQTIHPTAILENEVHVSEGVVIEPYCHIVGPVEIGKDTKIASFCYIRGPAKIGERNRINPHCVIGTEPESRDAKPTGSIIIGNDNNISEFTAIQRGTGDRDTEIGDNNFIMDNVHISHDNKLGNNVTIAPNVVLGGHTVVHDGATIGIASSTHQFSTIGAYSMIGMNSTVTKDVPPFTTVFGNPAKIRKWNVYQMEKLGMQSPPSGGTYERYCSHFVTDSRREILDISSIID